MKNAGLTKSGLQGLGYVLIASVILGLTGCSGKPSERACLRMVENAMAKDGSCRIEHFKKVNAVSGSTFGQETYTVQCTWDATYLKDTPGGFMTQGHKKGEVVHTPDGNLIFTKTEKGWQGLDGQIY
jgi:hypothetical protein